MDKKKNLDKLAIRDNDTGQLNVIIETPKGSRNKYKYDTRYKYFSLSGTLPAGASFPYDFGFIPQTLAEDGDPVDVLLLMDEPAFSGCIIPVRCIGVIEAEQTERNGKTVRNDRLIAVSNWSHVYEHIKDIKDISPNLLKELAHFFVSYNEVLGKNFKPIKFSGMDKADKLIKAAVKKFREE